MKSAYLPTTLGIIVALAVPAIAETETAEQAAARAKALMVEGNLEDSLAAYATAARADSSNRAYVQQYSLLRRVIQVRKQLESEQDGNRWVYLAQALRAFYISQGIYTEALSLDEQIHARLSTASSAVTLAETQLAMDRNAEAAKTIGTLGADQATPTTQALLGIALAREGKMDEAQRLAASIRLSDETDPRTAYTVARLQSATGNAQEALKLLGRCFQSTPPSLLGGYKEHARECPEFTALASTAAFAEVLETKSAVPESGCSGGKSCAGCPMRGKCQHGQTEASKQ